MKKILLLSFLFQMSAYAQPSIQWQKSLGGTGDDQTYSIEQTTDGGYIVGGESSSNDGDVSGNHGGYDYWVAKLSGTGVIEWQKSLGGTGDETVNSIQQTKDGGYIVVGTSYSTDGDVSGNHGDADYWIVKLDSGGGIQWEKSYGGSRFDKATSIQQTTDGGYIVGGNSESNDGDVSGNHKVGYEDYWIVKLDTIGSIQWQKCFGGTGNDEATHIRQTTDGGYILSGSTNSNDSDVSGFHGGTHDFWIVKLNGIGTMQWQKSLGGSGDDVAFSIRETIDGGYITQGYSASNDGDASGNHGSYDCWVVKLNSSGAIQWQKSLGGSSIDAGFSIKQSSDSGFVVAGYSGSNDNDVSGNRGGADFWIVKLRNNGNLQWQKCLGGSNSEFAGCIYQTLDGGYVAAGQSNSNDGDVSGNHGNNDAWIVKLSSYNGLNELNPLPFSVYPNPTTSSFTLELSFPMQDAEVIIYDMFGHEQLRKKLTGLKTEIQRGDLAAGVYFARVNAGDKWFTQKIMIQ